MNPQAQLQPIAPRPQLEYAEPAARPLELKPGPRPLDLRPRPSPRPQLNVKMGPPSPQELARQRSSPLGNPLNVTKPVLNNPLGYAPGKGVASFAALLLERSADPETFGIPAENFQESGLGDLALPSFSPDAIAPGAITEEGVDPPFSGGQLPGVSYNVTGTVIAVSPYTGTVAQGTGSLTVTGPVSFIGSRGGATRPNCTISSPNDGWINARDVFLQFRVNEAFTTVVTGVGNWGPLSCVLRSAFIDPADVAEIQNVVVQRVDGQPDTGGDPAGGVQEQRAPNAARTASAANLPQRQPRAPFKPIPIPSFALPDLRSPQFPQIAPTEAPAIDPDVPVLPLREPFKFPAPVTIPGFPGNDTNAPDAPTKRPPPVQFPPSLPGTTGREIAPPKLPRIPPIFIPPLRRDDCATAADLVRESSRIRDLIEDILDKLLDDCKDLCGEAQLTRSFCEEVDGQLVAREQFTTFLALAPALGFLSREIADIKAAAAPCTPADPASVPPVVLAGGSMIEGATVAYVDILPEVRQVELIITGQLPNSVRLYDSTLSGEQQGKFGAITLAYPGVTGGNAPDAFHQWAWTRRTSFYVGPPIRNDRRIRINLKAGLTWVLYDTGLRS